MTDTATVMVGNNLQVKVRQPSVMALMTMIDGAEAEDQNDMAAQVKNMVEFVRMVVVSPKMVMKPPSECGEGEMSFDSLELGDLRTIIDASTELAKANVAPLPQTANS